MAELIEAKNHNAKCQPTDMDAEQEIEKRKCILSDSDSDTDTCRHGSLTADKENDG